jgi:hypothetical protein
MYPVIPAEMMSGAVQLVIYFFTALGAFLGLFLSGRA